MGNTINNQASIFETLDKISSDYILSMDYNALSRMGNEEYCNKFTMITKDILDKQFNKLDIQYLSIRIKKGHKPLIDIFNTTSNTDIPEQETIQKNEQVLYAESFTTDNKQQMCLNISRFYIKIGHLFAAIVKALDPVYIVEGKQYPFNTPKKQLPPNASVTISETGICHAKIKALQFGYVPNNKLNPQFCNIHQKYNTISNYNGIPELTKLYYDKIDYTGKPYMSEKSRQQYISDLHLLYYQFTKNKSESPSINDFTDITLNDYHNDLNCNNNTFNTPITQSEKDNILFIDYADNLKEMLYFSKQKERVFLEIINEIFTSTNTTTSSSSSSDTSKKLAISINPHLTDDRLNELITSVRNNLLEFYIKNDEYFNNGVDIYTAIVLYRKLHKQLENINELSQPSESSSLMDNNTKYDMDPTDGYTEEDNDYKEDNDAEPLHNEPINELDEKDNDDIITDEDEEPITDYQYDSENNTMEPSNNNTSPYGPLFNSQQPLQNLEPIDDDIQQPIDTEPVGFPEQPPMPEQPIDTEPVGFQEQQPIDIEPVGFPEQPPLQNLEPIDDNIQQPIQPINPEPVVVPPPPQIQQPPINPEPVLVPPPLIQQPPINPEPVLVPPPPIQQPPINPEPVVVPPQPPNQIN
jgi:hypothetical protein